MGDENEEIFENEVKEKPVSSLKNSAGLEQLAQIYQMVHDLNNAIAFQTELIQDMKSPRLLTEEPESFLSSWLC